jgi:hypothetical protein
MSAKPTKLDCSGCRDDFYNHRTNVGGSTSCWSLESAVFVMRREVPLSQVPPHQQTPIKVPNCYRRPGYVYMKP